MARRRRRARNGGEASGGAILLALCFFLIVGGLGALTASKTPSGRTAPSGTTTYGGSISSAGSSSPAVVYAALPSTPVPAAETKPASLFDRDLRSRQEPDPDASDRAVVGKRYVSGHKVPLRALPRGGSAILDRLGPGHAVEVIEEGSDWTRVRDEMTRREGWIQTRRLTEQAPVEDEKAPPPPSPLQALGVAAIAKLLIAESIASYPNTCACPYQRDRGGRACGRRAAYSRPGGYAPLCFAHDVTPAMIAGYRERQSSTVASR